MAPDQIIALLKEALALHQAGQLAEATALYQRVRHVAPRNFDAAHLLGTAALQQGRFGPAAAALTEARRLDPRSSVCAMRLGVALQALGRPAKAEIELRSALTLDPSLPEGWFHLAQTLEHLGRIDEAISCLERAVATRPDYAEAYDRLGTILFTARGPVAAESAARRALELQPGFARGWCNLGIYLVHLGRLGEALACFDRALALDPALHHAHAGRGLALERWHRTAEAVAAYDSALAGDPRNHQARSARLMALHYLAGIPREKLLLDHQAFGEAAGVAPDGEIAFDPDPDRRIRIGFLSPNLRTHAVAYFLEPLLAHLSPGQFEVFLYHDHPVVDATSERLRGRAACWRHVAGRSDAALGSMLRLDRLDILVDLAGHTELNRMALLARRVAPVQVTYLGYPDTTGIASMDYRLVDEISDPPGTADRLATESLVRFAPTAWCYGPPAEAPVPSSPDSRRGGPVVFGCFNNFSKVTDEMLRAWGRILALAPGSRLLLKSRGLGHEVLQALARRRLEAEGIDPARVDFLDHAPDVAGHLASYGRIDVALDTFPYNGTTTTCEALWMGVPVISLVGDRHASRVGASLLAAVGRTEWIAGTADEYVRKAAALAADPARLAAERFILRLSMAQSPLLDHAGQTARFAAALRILWRKRCETARPAEACAV
jgi:protein O-GlcNAc transferase